MAGFKNYLKIRGWEQAFAVYGERRIISIFFMGFSSGLPLALTGSTLAVWMAESGVSLTKIGFFVLVGISYNLKFLWSPLMDRAPIPWLTGRLGRRRSWALVTQIALMAALVGLGHSDPAADLEKTALLAVLVAFFSASQDIVIDAFRIDLLAEHEQGAGAASTQLGYRGGLLVAGAGALYAATYGGWGFAYVVMAGFMVVGMAAVLLTPEPPDNGRSGQEGEEMSFSQQLHEAVVAPFADFMGRHGEWMVILIFILFYKFGDAVAGVMANPFYVAMGFTKIEIADVSKIFGVAATVAGIVVGGAVVYRLGIFRALLLCGILQALSNLMFAYQATVGHDVGLLVATIGLENLTGGMGSAAFVAYLSSLCSHAFSATQYALLSSVMALGRTVLASGGGWAAQEMGWVPFFIGSTFAAVPGLLLLLWLMRRAQPT
ncbi:MAG: AmpG family muropeptide MFS transporter [Alphaproteobacteria bacterium]|nr:AmpG family muropeptide MFS transporter [Alphaproteobacteria bacterium]